MDKRDDIIYQEQIRLKRLAFPLLICFMLLLAMLAACQTDDRVVAAFLGGSYTKGTADVYSDLDLYLITTDQAYEEFLSDLNIFIRFLGEPWFLENFGTPFALFFIFSDHTEGELWIGRESDFHHIYMGDYLVLLDKVGI